MLWWSCFPPQHHGMKDIQGRCKRNNREEREIEIEREWGREWVQNWRVWAIVVMDMWLNEVRKFCGIWR